MKKFHRALRSLTIFSPLMLLLACASSAPPEKTVTNEEEKMVIRVILEVAPENASAFEKALESEREEVLKFDGCERYALFRSPSSPTSYLLYEEWRDAAAFKRFQASDVLKRSFQVLGPLLSGPPQSAYFRAVQVGPS